MQFDPQDPLQVQTLLDDLEVAGVSCFLKGNYPDAIKVFTYGLSVCEHVYAVDGNSHGQIRTASMLLNLGITLGKVGEHSEAVPSWKVASGKGGRLRQPLPPYTRAPWRI